MGACLLRIRRCTSESELLSVLHADEPDVLPLLFGDDERNRISWTVDPILAALPPGAEQSYTSLDIRGGPDDWVLAPPSGLEALLARRYAAITDRPLVLIDLAAGRRPSIPSGKPRSITSLCRLNEQDMAATLHALCRLLMARLGEMPRLGVLTSESAATLSVLLAKQLLPARSDPNDRTTVVSRTPPSPQSSLRVIDGGLTMREIASGIHDAKGTLFLNAHSRPHCGIFAAADGLVGLCGLASGGRDGRCVAGSVCSFRESPRAVLQDLNASRVYFNGCTTVGVGTRRTDFLPRDAMVGHAILRGGARELVGNVWSGHYDDSDVHWFLGASALGYTPAECVEIVTAARASTGREFLRSLLYVGDATNQRWPVAGVSVAEAEATPDGARLRWSQVEPVLVARLPDRSWAELAERDQLYVVARPRSRPVVSLVRDPFSEASLVLVLPRHAVAGDGPDLEVVLRALPRPVERSAGRVLARAVRHVRWIERLPAFAKSLTNASHQLEDELVALRRAQAWRHDVGMLPELLSYAREREEETAIRFDRRIVDEALARTRGYWNWHNEYAARVEARPRRQQSTCPVCGASAHDVDYQDWVDRSVRRTSRVCGFCGIVSDLPVWPLRAQFVAETLVPSETGLTGVVEIGNDGDRPRRVCLGVGVERGGEVLPGSKVRTELVVSSGETCTYSFCLTGAQPMSELLQTRLYLASEGAFGVLTAFVLFGRHRRHTGRAGRPAGDCRA